MVKCHWCSKDVEKKDLMVLDLFMPHATEAGIPNIRITNNLCGECQKRILKTLGELELSIKKDLFV